jgi:acetyl esterase/lipase
MRGIRFVTAALGILGAVPVLAQTQLREVEIRRDVQYATHEGVALAGDYYVPKAPGKYPVLVAVHGGGWSAGTQAGYKYLGPYLAERGIALYAIAYRLAKLDQPSYPQAPQDVRAAVQFVKRISKPIQTVSA